MKNNKAIATEYGRYYHVYNRGINSGKVFADKDDYLHFLNLMSIYIEPIADIYAYALMGNHFHIALRIKEENEIGFLNSKNVKTDDLDLKWKTYFPNEQEIKDKSNFTQKPVPQRMIQHMLNAYAKGFNKKYKRTGGLFEYKYNRILIENETYLKRLIRYIHNNPVKHGICESAIEYSWTSYLNLTSIKPTKLARERVIGWFNDKANFIFAHSQDDDISDIEDLLLE